MTVSGEHAGLEYDLADAPGAPDGTVALLLHGRGSHKGDLQALGPVLPDAWTLITPQAPYPGADWGYGPGWAWYRYVAEDRVQVDTLERSLALLDGFLEGLPELVGFAPTRVVMGGFSQGGTTSLAYGLTRPGRLSAALNFSGFLADSLTLPEAGSGGSTTPVFWGHGLSDSNIPFPLAERGRARLTEAGVPLATADYPIGHWMVPEEIHAAVAMIDAAG